MHVVLAADRWGEALGGRERYLANLADAARQAGHRVEVLCREAGGTDREVRVLPVPRFPRIAQEALFQHALTARLALHSGPSLAAAPVRGATHCQLHSGLMRAALEAERDSLEPGPARWFFRTGSLLNARRLLLLRREERLLSSANRPRLMVWSHALSGELTQRYGIPTEEIAVLAPGIDGRFHPGKDPTGADSPPRGDAPLRLLFAAHNFRLKGLAPLLEALSRARRRGLHFRLTVAGRGPRVFRALAARAGIGAHVDFLGAVPPTRMPELYRAHDALVHPTFHDPCSLVVLEALASGCPVVTTRRNGASEWFEAGRHGLVIDDPRDTDALSEAIGALAEASRRRRMSEEAAGLGRRFDFAAHAERVFAWLA